MLIMGINYVLNWVQITMAGEHIHVQWKSEMENYILNSKINGTR